ncbi:4Fe-4S dicluster domain-containing protein [Candidatus Bathyarchaeota archaeon]|nr:4Fe-4S dicluster domain-containing protein [Candidatus Bathyarchaeota archaeon]
MLSKLTKVQAAEAPKQYGMVIDLRRCIGCHACSMACKLENNQPTGLVDGELETPNRRINWSIVLGREDGEQEKGKYPLLSKRFLPRTCMHCIDPPCTKVCPVDATYRRPEDGIVVVNYDRCIGCRYCMSACPYGARYFNWKKPDLGRPENPQVPVRPVGVVEKCTFCKHRIERGLEPACVETCLGRARIFGELSDPNSKVSKLIRERGAFRLLEDYDTKPSWYYLPW